MYCILRTIISKPPSGQLLSRHCSTLTSTLKEYAPIFINIPRTVEYDHPPFPLPPPSHTTTLISNSLPLSSVPKVEHKLLEETNGNKTRLWANDKLDYFKLKVEENDGTSDDEHSLEYNVEGSFDPATRLFKIDDMKYKQSFFHFGAVHGYRTTDHIVIQQIDQQSFDDLKCQTYHKGVPPLKAMTTSTEKTESELNTHTSTQSTLYVPHKSLFATLQRSDDGILTFKWLRFRPLYTTTADGTEVFDGFVPSVIDFIPVEGSSKKDDTDKRVANK